MWNSKLNTIYSISTFLVLVGIFVFTFWEKQVFLLHLDGLIVAEIWRFLFFTRRHNLSVTWGPSSWISTVPSFGDHEPVNMEAKHFWFFTRPRNRCVTWLCRWGFHVVSYHSAKFGVHRPCESGDITFLICHVTTISNCHVTFWVGSLHLKSPNS